MVVWWGTRLVQRSSATGGSRACRPTCSLNSPQEWARCGASGARPGLCPGCGSVLWARVRRPAGVRRPVSGHARAPPACHYARRARHGRCENEAMAKPSTPHRPPCTSSSAESVADDLVVGPMIDGAHGPTRLCGLVGGVERFEARHHPLWAALLSAHGPADHPGFVLDGDDVLALRYEGVCAFANG